jgi:hypothetical protein
VTTVIAATILCPGQGFLVIDPAIQRNAPMTMILFGMIADRPRNTACQREQEKPDYEQVSEKHHRPATGFNNSI